MTGVGVIVLGRLTISGSPRTPTFARLARVPRASDVSLLLEEAVTGWSAGDRLVLPNSQQFAPASSASYTSKTDELITQAVSADRKTLTLASALRYDHPGAVDGNGGVTFLPHVGNLGRNVVIRSENAAGTRGHLLATSRADVDIRYALFRDLARTTVDPLNSMVVNGDGSVRVGTNQIGRYPIHMHHLMGPAVPPANGYQFTLIGNAIDGGSTSHKFKWGITVHNSHYGLVSDNVVFNASGGGIVAEDGSESFNVFDHNFVLRTTGVDGRGDERIHFGDFSYEGSGFWFRGPNNVVRNNVAADSNAYGYKLFFTYLGNVRVPNFAGADTSVAGQYTLVNGNGVPLRDFAENEAYGGISHGITVWWLCASDATPTPNCQRSTIRNFRLWNHSGYGFYGYPLSQLTFDGWTARGAPGVLANSNEYPTSIWFGDYMAEDVVIRNADIQGYRDGIIPSPFVRGSTTIEDSFLRNVRGISVITIGSPGSAPYGPAMPPKTTIVRNVKFQTVSGNVGGIAQRAISMNYGLHYGSANLVKNDSVHVYDFNQEPGRNFRAYYTEQAPNFIVPQSTGNLAGSPQAGLSNRDNWTLHSLAIAGAVAPCTTTIPEVAGFVCSPTQSPPTTHQPSAPTNVRISN